MFVAGVLIMTAAAALKIRTPRGGASRRSCHDSVDPAAGKARLLLNQGGFDCLALEDEGYEGGFPSAAFIRGQASQAVATVNEFFYGEFQELILQILRGGHSCPPRMFFSWTQSSLAVT